MFLLNVNKKRIISKNMTEGIQHTMPWHNPKDKVVEVLTSEGVRKWQKYALAAHTSVEGTSKNDPPAATQTFG